MLQTGRHARVALAPEAQGKDRGKAVGKNDAVTVPRTSMSINPTTTTVMNPSSIGVLEPSFEAQNIIRYSDIAIDGIGHTNFLGHFFNALYSNATTTSAASVYTHVFSLEQKSQSDTYTIFYKNDEGDFQVPHSILSSLDLSMTAGEYITFSSTWMGKLASTMSSPPSFTHPASTAITFSSPAGTALIWYGRQHPQPVLQRTAPVSYKVGRYRLTRTLKWITASVSVSRMTLSPLPSS